MAYQGLIVLLAAAQSIIPQVPAAWSTDGDVVRWSDRSSFPFNWYRDEGALVLIDARGVETGRWSIDEAIGDPGLRLLELTGNADGTLFALWTKVFEPSLTELQLAARVAKGGGTRLLVLNADGDGVYQTAGYATSPSVLLSSDRFLVYERARGEQSRSTVPEIRDVRGNVIAELPEAVYWDAQTMRPSADAFYTWSFPQDCCGDRLVFDVGELTQVGTLTKWDRNGEKIWSVDTMRQGRNPAEFAAASDGHVVLRYGRRWETQDIVSLDGSNGREVARRRFGDRARLMRDQALFLLRPAGDGRDATLSLLDPPTLDDTLVSALPEDRVSELVGPASDTGLVIARLTKDGHGARWYVLRHGVEPRSLGNGTARVSGAWVFWSDERGARVLGSSDLLGGAR